MARKKEQIFEVVLELDRLECCYCQGLATQVDLVIPKIIGGPEILENMVACCDACDKKKDASLDIDYIQIGFQRIVARHGYSTLDWVMSWGKGEPFFTRLTADVVEKRSRQIERMPYTAPMPANKQFTVKEKQLVNRCALCNKFFKKNGTPRCGKCR